MSQEDKKFETIAVRAQTQRSHNREHSVPIYATSSFTFEDADHANALFSDEVDGNIYSRYSNPNNDEFINKLVLLEGAEAGIATSSGMAAMFLSIASFVSQGDHIVASRSLFGSTHQILTQLLPKWGVSHTYVDIHDLEGFEKAIQPTTKMIFIETPSNPALDIIDIEALAKIADKHNIILNVDNCFATPYLQNPLKHGAHIVTHSATKFIDGQGRVLAGAILGSQELMDKVKFMSRHTGPALSPFHGWILSKSLETLSIRMEKHCESAMKVAKALEQMDEVELVKYPFLPSHPGHELAKKQMRLGGALVSFEIKGGVEAGKKFWNSLQLISKSSNLGDTRTIATHPASTTHSKLTEEERLAVGITPGLIRISVGLEHVDDIIADIKQAMK
ncbi:aminotransferase class I/II-fold pyridoxal phosphate-dependent enzyme [Flammeovirga yaeyamensis]|uniref:O-succinylhomoserine sulfhydrylase n=1 Tax=Flammeovirga yaeyamensis TaxID=367791 RepID=A0AAX1N0F6_9BACT|nr:aminotransferase class I/II-fold pyridoxal phosphate-dependent enzyme [Flammeovirga yaeyamensis]MBB3698660.1 O-succinylhomoserine sulfhydrylase [Flammeovirga yaeyamensis]NMF33995.1 aminotransferase class I/II-fold pyridoxal phosphate-dependent enzyme [Flammeovirga yaeyamensis]QWG00984.1 aminotransferase class I/II-fold pyridoxal phosphate-dependent enzyme [Flammeovirga yaeyamensis]